MTCYLVCFAQRPLFHASHYLGYCDDNPEKRLERHRKGQGSKLLRAVGQAGIDFKIVRVWAEGNRELERKLKNGKNNKLLCPLCCDKAREIKREQRRQKRLADKSKLCS